MEVEEGVEVEEEEVEVEEDMEIGEEDLEKAELKELIMKTERSRGESMAKRGSLRGQAVGKFYRPIAHKRV